MCQDLQITSGTEVVELHEYSEETAAGTNSNSSTTPEYTLCTDKCSRWLWDCGPTPPTPRPPSWVPCFKQHRSIYRLRDVREPVGFTLSTRHKRLRRAASNARTSTSLRYMLTPGLLQDIENNKNPIFVCHTFIIWNELASCVSLTRFIIEFGENF